LIGNRPIEMVIGQCVHPQQKSHGQKKL